MPLAPYKFQLKVLPSFRAIIWPAAIPPFLRVFDNTKTTMDLRPFGELEDDLIEDIIIEELLEGHQSRPESKRMRTSMRGHDYIHELLKSRNHERIHQVLRMRTL